MSSVRPHPPRASSVGPSIPLTHQLSTPSGAPLRAPDLTPDGIVARAEAIAATLVARQAETEQRTFYAEDTHEAFRQAGLYRVLTPRRYGGHGFGVGTFVRIATALARGCPSTGWMYAFGHAHALVVATLFDETAQAELFAGGDFICPATVAPGGRAVRTDGGWIVDGTWRYCSGSPYATHFLGHTLVPTGGNEPAPLLFVLPRDRWERLDDWGGQLGLRGSGSHSITAGGAAIPDRWVRHSHISQYSAADPNPGKVLHDAPEYGGGPLGFMFLGVAALAVGMAQGALDVYTDLMRTRTTIYPPIVGRTGSADYQFWFGEATGLVATAEAALRDGVRQWDELSAAGPAAFTAAQDARIASICREVVKMSWRAVEGQIFPTAGSSAVRSGERLERVWRDLSMLHSHAGISVFLSWMANRALAQATFDDGISFDAL